MNYLISPWDEPLKNGALELYALSRMEGEVLLLYRNRPSVIVGRNQTLEAEVDLDYCRKQGIEVVRRISGGGTVYHDLGNINYAFISDRGEGMALDREPLVPLISVLARLGVEARAGARSELLCGDCKISGTASHVARSRQLFHGTLLHRTDLNALHAALAGDRSLRGKGVASVPSPVMNLCEVTGREERTAAFMERLVAGFAAYYDWGEPLPLPSEATLTTIASEFAYPVRL